MPGDAEHAESQIPQADTEAMLAALPKELQETLRAFQANLVRSIIAQQTRPQGEEYVISVKPERADWYKDRLEEVVESGFLNPHVNPQMEIK